MKRKTLAIFLGVVMAVGSLTGCADTKQQTQEEQAETESTETASDSEKEYIEETLNLANNEAQEWTYDADSDAWILSVVSAVVYPEIEDEQGVSVCVPGAYVTGIDENGDGKAETTAATYTAAVKGALVIDYNAQITSTNGQTYTAGTAPVIVNTGAAGYSSSTNTLAATTYAKEGYINVACGNRGKQDSVTDESGTVGYTGDAPCCLVDQKNATRFVKYNILLGNLPGNVDYFVSTGGSGGGAHATMLAATSNHSDFYDYEIAAGAVGVYKNADGTYSTTVTIDGKDYDISDGVWGCIAYSAITSLAEADMAEAFEYTLDTTYDFGSAFQKQVASYLSEEYMEYINEQNLSVEESAVGFDLNQDGDLEDTIPLTIEYDAEKYADTNGYGGTYLDLYLAEFEANLQNYLDNLDYADGWTWFDEDGNALSDEAVAAMTDADKAEAFIEGRYAKNSSDGMGEMPGAPGGTMPEGGAPDGTMPEGGAPDGTMPEGGAPDGEKPDNSGAGGEASGSDAADAGTDRSFDNQEVAANSAGDTMDVGTPDAGTTQASGSSSDSANYASYEEMLAAYQKDIAEIEAGDQYGNNIVDLYNPLQYIGDEGTENPAWVRIVCGASEGDISMFSSMNLQIAMLNAGIDCDVEWQWDGGHVPSEILGDSFALYVDEMYGSYVQGAAQVEKAPAEKQTVNGDATEADGKDISSWVTYDDTEGVSFTLSAAAAYRTAGASKAVPGFDVIDYGQEDYVFGDSDSDARHWDSYLLKVLEEHEEELSALFNAGK